jgi:hypothetical protein
MSELFAVSVEAVSKTSAKLAVKSVHPDSGPPRATSTFALMLVYDPIALSGYSEMEAYHHLETSPLAAEMDGDNYLDPTWLKKNANAFIAKTTVTKGVLQVWPTHPAWIEHLRVGMAWETPAFSNGPGEKAAPRAPSNKGTTHSKDKAEGFRIGSPKTDLEGETPKGAYIPLFGPSRYVADPVLTDPKAIAGALAALTNEPVLVVPKRGPSEVGTLVQPRSKDGRVWFHLYHETRLSYGYMGVNIDDVKSIGRAWLKTASARPPR